MRLGSKVLVPLSQYFGNVFKLGTFPECYEVAKVIPILKSGSKHQVNNYRPISLLPSLSKILEKLIKIRLVRFFKKQNMFYDFMEKHSVIHALLDVTSLGYDAIQDKNFSALLLMDFRKAFDTVPHKTLLQKLYHYGIRGPA